MFLAFQYPVELPGVGNANFMRTALNAIHRSRGEPELDAMQFLKMARERLRARWPPRPSARDWPVPLRPAPGFRGPPRDPVPERARQVRAGQG